MKKAFMKRNQEKMASAKAFWQDETGLSTLEYIIGAGVMAGLALFVFSTVLKGSISDASEKVGSAISTAGNQATNGAN